MALPDHLRGLEAYELGDLLGCGGMGAVYAAHQRALDRPVVIKILHPALARDPLFVERFHVEALAGGRLSHPNVAGVIDFGLTDDGTPYLVMERVPGERLGTIVAREGALPIARALALVTQLLSALGAIHASGVVHADVKCDNLLVATHEDGRETAVLIDFGIARLVDRPLPLDPAWAGPNRTSGTPEYLAPEVIGGASPSPASDLYAVGVVLYELLTGTPPFRGVTPADTFRAHLDDEPIAPSLRCPDVTIPPALDRIVLQTLAKEPAQRPTSAAELARALAAATERPRETGEIAVPRTISTRTFSTESPTQDWPAAPRNRIASGTTPIARDNTDELRAAIGRAIVAGDAPAITSGYVALSRALVARRRPDLAAWELEQAVDVLTAGAGVAMTNPPPSLWRVLVVLAAIYDDLGELERAKETARGAKLAAARVDSVLGVERAASLLARLEHATVARVAQ